MDRTETDELAAAAAGRIAAGLGAMYSDRWGPRTRTATVREIPGMAVRSVFVLGEGVTEAADMRRVWSELGDGSYLLAVEQGGEQQLALVDVAGGVVDVEPVSPAELRLLMGSPLA